MKSSHDRKRQVPAIPERKREPGESCSVHPLPLLLFTVALWCIRNKIHVGRDSSKGCSLLCLWEPQATSPAPHYIPRNEEENADHLGPKLEFKP